MWKWFKRLIVLVIVLFFAVVALLIPDKIDSQDQLKNVSTQTSLADLAQAGIGGASLSSGGVSTEINLDSNQFRQILKASMADSNDETLQNSSVELNDSYLTAKVPVSLGPIESTFSLDFTVHPTRFGRCPPGSPSSSKITGSALPQEEHCPVQQWCSNG